LGIASLFGSLLGIPWHFPHEWQWAIFCFLTACVGSGIGGNLPIDSTILLEFLPQNKRFLLATVSTFQPIGVIICNVISYLIIPKYSCADDAVACHAYDGENCCTQASNMGWRYMFFVTGAITVTIFCGRFLVFTFIESPKFLLTKGKDDEAILSVQQVAKYNKRECSLNILDFAFLEAMYENECQGNELVRDPETPLLVPVRRPKAGHLHRLRELFGSWSMSRLTVLTWIVYAFDAWGFSIAGAFGPKILKNRGQKESEDPSVFYMNYIIIACYGIPGTILATTLIEVPRLGRKFSMVISSFIMGASCIAFVLIDQPVTMLGLEYFSQSLFNAILYGWTAEAYPARLRGTACGLASTFGRLSSILSPLAAGLVLETKGPEFLLYMAGGGIFVCTVAILFLPETKGKQTL